MRRRVNVWAKRAVLSICAVALAAPPAAAQEGFVLTGAGPVNRSMGGAAVAGPLDSVGALYWNPATTSALPNSMDIGLELLWPRTTVGSSLPANAFGAGTPSVAGSTRGDNGVFALPTVGLIYQPDDSPFTFGLGAFPVGGFGVNYAASAGGNPILTAPPFGHGVGGVFSEFQVLQIAPTVAVRITDRLSIGIGPVVDLAMLRFEPAFIFAPDDANGDGVFHYSGATHARTTWGGGFQVGAYLTLDNGWQFGASYKSPQWFETFHYQSADELGLPRSLALDFDFPAIYSIGVGYIGMERWLFAADFRYVDFESDDILRRSGFDSTGAVRGLGWRNIFAVAVGAQYQWSERLSVRGAYSFNENPIPNDQANSNVASPTINEHIVYVGASYRVTGALTFSVAYAHAFENSIEGPFVTPAGAVPGSRVRNSTSVDSILVGASVTFGPCAAH